jgi:hypothetical protein
VTHKQKSENQLKGMQLTQGDPIVGSVPDDAVRDMAADAGNKRLYTEPWGENKQPHEIHIINEAATTGNALLGAHVDEQRHGGEETLERLKALIERLDSELAIAIMKLTLATKRVLEIEWQLTQAGKPLPRPRRHRRALLVAFLILIGLGELFILSPAFQILGISDARLVWFLPFSWQHVAALSGVVALLALAHALAEDHRPGGADPDPDRSWLQKLAHHSTGHRIHMLGVAFILIGFAAVREAYLNRTHEGNLALGIAFVLLNVGMVVGARSLARPDLREGAAVYHAALEEQAERQDEVDERQEAAEPEVGEYNAGVAWRNALFSQTGHAIDANNASARRKGQLFAARLRLEQPEMVEEQMLPDELPQPKDSRLRDQIDRYLNGETKGIPWRRYELMRLKKTDAARALMERVVAKCLLGENTDELEALLGEANEPEEQATVIPTLVTAKPGRKPRGTVTA